MRSVEAAGLRVSAIGLGTWQFGSREWGYGHEYAHGVAPALLRRAIDLGITLIDTAEAYGPHTSEHIIGEALAGLDPETRATLTVATKFMPIAPVEPILDRQVRGSARRLGVEHLDLLYAHWPNPFVSPRRVMQSIRPLVEEGVVDRVAVSNYTLAQWQEAERALHRPVVANQVRFSLVSPQPAADLVPYAAAMDRLVVAYSPIGQGVLARSASADGDTGTGRSVNPIRRMNPLFRGSAAERLLPLQVAVREIARAHDASAAQVALAWVISHPNTVAIPGARTVDQLAENAAAADLVLAAQELARLTEASEVFA
jgi:aryl-alcohol dehydrogenase-like predicted oxidoreductase